jgi:uridylate kinase
LEKTRHESAAPQLGVASGPRYSRVLLKLSGEALGGQRDYGIDFDVIRRIAKQIKLVHEMGVQIALVVGGGNIFRGQAAAERGFDRTTGDYMGMLGTVINALAMQDVLEKKNIDTRVMTAIRMEEIAEPYIRRRAQRHLDKGRVVIFAGGTGNPYFSTDTAAVLRGIQMKADVIIKATSVDGIYSADPKKDTTATMYETLSYKDVIRDELGVMDQTAITLCRENSMPLIVLNISRPGSVASAIRGDRVGTLVQ